MAHANIAAFRNCEWGMGGRLDYRAGRDREIYYAYDLSGFCITRQLRIPISTSQ